MSIGRKDKIFKELDRINEILIPSYTILNTKFNEKPDIEQIKTDIIHTLKEAFIKGWECHMNDSMNDIDVHPRRGNIDEIN